MSRPQNTWYENAFDAPYLAVYKHRDAQEAEEATRVLVEPLGLKNSKVLDLACGAGRYSRILRGYGADVTGIDLSRELLARAWAETNPQTAFVRGNMLQIPFRSASFDLVVSMFTSFGYFESPEQDLSMLLEINRVLRSSGHFVLDFLNATRVRQTLVASDTRQVSGYEVREQRRIDEQRNVVVKNIELIRGTQTLRYKEVVRLWSRTTLKTALSKSGLEVLKCWGNYNGDSFIEASSPRLIFLCQKVPLPQDSFAKGIEPQSRRSDGATP